MFLAAGFISNRHRIFTLEYFAEIFARDSSPGLHERIRFSIMNFELKTLEHDGLSTEKCDALVVLVASNVAGRPTVVGKDACSQLLTTAVKAGDFEAKTGKLLVSYRPAGDRKSTRLNSSHRNTSRMPSSA